MEALLNLALIICVFDVVFGFETLTSFQICETVFNADGNVGATSLQGTYTASDTDDSSGKRLFLPFSNGDNDFELTAESSSSRYHFAYGDGGSEILEFDTAFAERVFFRYLYSNKDINTCNESTPTLNEFCSEDDTLCNSNYDSDDMFDFGELTSISAFDNDLQFVAIGTFSDVYDSDDDIYDPGEYTLNEDGTLSDGSSIEEIDCSPAGLKLCHEMSEFLGREYLGFEAFTDDAHCDVAQRTNKGFRCKTCDSGYRKYANGDANGGGNINHRCAHKNTYFPNCANSINRGCKECDDDYTLKAHTLPTWGNYCPYGYCIHGDNDNSDDQAESTDGIPRECWTQQQRIDAEIDGYIDQNGNPVDGTGETGYQTGKFWISDPWNQTECIDGAISGEAVYCVEDGLCDHDDTAGCHIDGSCSQCLNQPYENFKLSRFHRCQDVQATFGSGCILGNEGYGCGQCDGDNVETIYNEANNVWYCPFGENVTDNAEDFTSNNQDKEYSAWVCPQLANDSQIIYDNEAQAFGVDCYYDMIGETYENADGTTRDGQCVDCIPGHLCGQCSNDNGDNPSSDYFRASTYHHCTNCAETFGIGCKFCDDYRGCGQCYDDYLLQYDACCDIWYCI